MKEIVYHDRYLNQLCSEKVYGDKFLRWTYETLGGKLALATFVKRAWFSRWYGWRMDRATSRMKIAPFIQDYDLDPDEFAKRPEDFENFNDFFSRSLKSEVRPIDADPASLVFPADGRHLCVPDLSKCDGLLVKGEMFDLSTLLDDASLASEYRQGSLIVSRLCPVDYHRFHFPASGRALKPRILNGPLYSVNPIALRQNIAILATNKRSMTILESEACGKVLQLEIGATCVGSIHQTYANDGTVAKGDEKGFFRFGGSSTILVFEPGRIRFAEDLVENSQQKRELYARMGDQMATLV